MSVYQLPVSQEFIAFRVVRRVDTWRVWAHYYVNSAGQAFYDMQGESELLTSVAKTSDVPAGFAIDSQFQYEADLNYALQIAASILGVPSVSQVSSLSHQTQEFTGYNAESGDESSSYGWRTYTTIDVGIDYCARSSEYHADDDAGWMLMPSLAAIGLLASAFLLMTPAKTRRRTLK